MSVTLGAVLSTVTPFESLPVFPAPSVAVAVTVRAPSATVALFQEADQPSAPFVSVPIGVPLTENVTRVTPLASVAVAWSVVVPETVAPSVGAVSVTVGAVLSTVIPFESLPVFAAVGGGRGDRGALPSATVALFQETDQPLVPFVSVPIGAPLTEKAPGDAAGVGGGGLERRRAGDGRAFVGAVSVTLGVRVVDRDPVRVAPGLFERVGRRCA